MLRCLMGGKRISKTDPMPLSTCNMEMRILSLTKIPPDTILLPCPLIAPSRFIVLSSSVGVPVLCDTFSSVAGAVAVMAKRAELVAAHKVEVVPAVRVPTAEAEAHAASAEGGGEAHAQAGEDEGEGEEEAAGEAPANRPRGSAAPLLFAGFVAASRILAAHSSKVGL